VPLKKAAANIVVKITNQHASLKSGTSLTTFESKVTCGAAFFLSALNDADTSNRVGNKGADQMPTEKVKAID